MATGDMILDISQFKGLDQSEGNNNRDIRTSPDMANFIIENGEMRTAPGSESYAPDLPQGGVTTLMEAVYHNDDGSTDYRLIAAAGDGLYRLNNGAWTQMGSGYASDRWDSLNYRKNLDEWHMITNGEDGMLYCGRNDAGYNEVEGVPAKGDYMTLSDERLWLSGVRDDQEIVYWSWDNDPNNWSVDLEHPEQGGGFVYVRTHDGSKVIAVRALLNDVVIFKDRSLHRMSGNYPGEYELIDVYGSTGPIAAKTIVSSGGMVYFLCAEGLCAYNGMTVQTLALGGGDNRLTGIAERINREAAGLAASVIFRNTMYIALPLDDSTVNNTVILWNMTDNTYCLMENYRVDSWLVKHEGAGEKLIFARDGRVMIMDGETDEGAEVNARWLSPWLEAGTKSARKTSGRVYMQIRAEGLDGALPTFNLTMESEKKKRTKAIALKKSGFMVIRPRVKLRGRTLRFGIETTNGTRMTIYQGIQIRVESDED